MDTLFWFQIGLFIVPFLVSVTLVKRYIAHRRKKDSTYEPSNGLVFSPIGVFMVSALTVIGLGIRLPLNSEQASYEQVAMITKVRQAERAARITKVEGDAGLKAQLVFSHMKDCLDAGPIQYPDGMNGSHGLGRALWEPTLITLNTKPEGLHPWTLTPAEATAVVDAAEKKCAGNFLASLQEADRAQIARVLQDNHYAIPDEAKKQLRSAR